ncbi:hypothetical protein BH10ACI2_BH10ACI2_08890 [soil metagenome]
MKLNTILILSIVMAAAILSLSGNEIEAQQKMTSSAGSEIVFPNVKGKNLLKKEMNLPQDLGGELNLVIVAFERKQQSTIDVWMPHVKALTERFPRLRYYEIPTISKQPFFVRSFIDGGMRSGIPDPKAREATITLYLDKQKFRNSLGITTEKKIYLFLVDRKGKVFGSWEDAYSAAKLAEIEKKVGEIIPTSVS